MRFEGRFTTRLAAAFGPLVEASDPSVRTRASRDLLEYMAAALDIAVGSSPEVDLLDMVTLVALGRDAMTRRWSVVTHGERGRAIADAFRTSFDDIVTIARSSLSDEVEAELESVIRAWQEENPNVDDVAAVRLSANADMREGASKLAKSTAGLFAVVRGAMSTADTAVLFGERALYVAQRLPFHLRFHARLATTDLVSDVRQGLLDSSRDAAVVRRADELMTGTTHWIDRNIWRLAVACGGVLVVASFSWLAARLAYERLS
jgi:hypothetical protein